MPEPLDAPAEGTGAASAVSDSAAVDEPGAVPDLVDALAGIVPGSRLDALRRRRPVARSDAQATYDALVADPADVARADGVERAALGWWVAALARADALTDHYAALLRASAPAVLAALADALPDASAGGPFGAYPPGPLAAQSTDGLRWTAPDRLRAAVGDRLAAALTHAHLLTFRPREAGPDALAALLDTGWSVDGVVTLSQLVAFTHFQLRVVAGLTVLQEVDR